MMKMTNIARLFILEKMFEVIICDVNLNHKGKWTSRAYTVGHV